MLEKKGEWVRVLKFDFAIFLGAGRYICSSKRVFLFVVFPLLTGIKTLRTRSRISTPLSSFLGIEIGKRKLYLDRKSLANVQIETSTNAKNILKKNTLVFRLLDLV